MGGKTHGMSRSPNGHETPEYAAWKSMRRRCGDVTWRNYGARGIRVCKEWQRSFAAFFAYVGPRPSPKHQLDRYPDNDGNYKPGNVRWATKQEQARNRRTNRRIASRLLIEWQAIAKARGISRGTFDGRIRRNWPIARALSTHRGNGVRKLTAADLRKILRLRAKGCTLEAVAEMFHVSHATISRASRGVTGVRP